MRLHGLIDGTETDGPLRAVIDGKGQATTGAKDAKRFPERCVRVGKVGETDPIYNAIESAVLNR